MTGILDQNKESPLAAGKALNLGEARPAWTCLVYPFLCVHFSFFWKWKLGFFVWRNSFKSFKTGHSSLMCSCSLQCSVGCFTVCMIYCRIWMHYLWKGPKARVFSLMKHLSLSLIRYNRNLNNWGYDELKVVTWTQYCTKCCSNFNDICNMFELCLNNTTEEGWSYSRANTCATCSQEFS